MCVASFVVISAWLQEYSAIRPDAAQLQRSVDTFMKAFDRRTEQVSQVSGILSFQLSLKESQKESAEFCERKDIELQLKKLKKEEDNAKKNPYFWCLLVLDSNLRSHSPVI